MPRVVISNSSTLILFQKINQFELLGQVYGSLLTTHEIAKEYGILSKYNFEKYDH